jgi:hypothetical protein
VHGDGIGSCFLISVNAVLAQFGNSRKSSCKRYREFIPAGTVEESSWKKLSPILKQKIGEFRVQKSQFPTSTRSRGMRGSYLS